MTHQLTLEQSFKFLFAGNSIFTIKSKISGKRYTFKVKTIKSVNGNSKPYFVSFLNGSDNISNYQFMGTIFTGETIKYFTSKKSKITKDSTVNKTFEWLLKTILTKNITNFNKIEFWHEGKCGKCGRKLTDPKSISSGFGPFCLTMVD